MEGSNFHLELFIILRVDEIQNDYRLLKCGDLVRHIGYRISVINLFNVGYILSFCRSDKLRQGK